MRLATIMEAGRPVVAVVDGERAIPLAIGGLESMRSIAAGGPAALDEIGRWLRSAGARRSRALAEVEFAPAVPNPGAIYTIGLNYVPDVRDGSANAAEAHAADRPLVYAKLPGSVSGHGAVVTWDRALTDNVDAEVELGVVIGEPSTGVTSGAAMGHVFGFTCINDMSSRDAWLDGDQWLLGKSLPGFCPGGPWIVTPEEVEPADLRLGCTVNGVAIQDGSTAGMRHGIADVLAYIGRHVTLQPGDLVATGTPARLPGPIPPETHLEAGDIVTVWIESIGELTTSIA
jgi:2-keto-4-pentenoate hydratase/2-oxohepta-3-ene-1,7-dioic acid hydratase in catechol pathway